MTSTQHVRVEGSSYQRGRQYGRQAATRVRLSVQAYQQTFAHYAGWDWPAVRREAARFEAPIGSVMPAYLEELRGIADGAGLDLADVLAINVRTEVMYAAKARQAPTAARLPAQLFQPAECSAFACVPAPGQNDPVLIGQNWDWLLHSAQTLVVLEVRQDEGPDFVTVVEAGLLAKTGMNAAGLGLVTNALVTDADVGEPGLPYHVLLRAVLDCTTVTDALEVLQAGPRSSSANYLIAQAGGAALDIEAAPGDFTRLYPVYPEDGVLRHTNHFLGDIHPADLALWAMPSSVVRLQRLRAAATARTLDDFGVAAGRSRRLPAQHLCPPRPGRSPVRAGRDHRLGADGPDRPPHLARRGQPLPGPLRAAGHSPVRHSPVRHSPVSEPVSLARPRALKEGDRVAVLCVSSPVEPEALNAGLDALRFAAWTRSPTRPRTTPAPCARTWPATTRCGPVTCGPRSPSLASPGSCSPAAATARSAPWRRWTGTG